MFSIGYLGDSYWFGVHKHFETDQKANQMED